MKYSLFLLIFTFLFVKAKSQSVFLYANEKVNGIEIPIERVDFDVTINDTILKKFVSKNDGSLGRISLEKGKYKLKLMSEEFSDTVLDCVIVNESKTTSINALMNRLNAQQLEEKKKNKKK